MQRINKQKIEEKCSDEKTYKTRGKRGEVY